MLISDIRALWRSGLSAEAPECQKLKNSGLDKYGAEALEQQQFGTAGVEGVNTSFQIQAPTAAAAASTKYVIRKLGSQGKYIHDDHVERNDNDDN